MLGFSFTPGAPALERRGPTVFIAPPPPPPPPANAPINTLVISADSQSIDDAETWAYHFRAAYPAKTIHITAQRSRTVGTQGTSDINTLAFAQASDAALNPQAVFTYIGHNDLPTSTVATFMANLQAWATFHRNAGRKVIIATPSPFTAAHASHVIYNQRRAEYLPLIRANWRDYCDALVDFGSHPDLNDPVKVLDLIGDGVHLTAFDPVGLDNGQNLAFDCFNATLGSLFDASRNGATSPYAGAWFGNAATVTPGTVVERRYIVRGLGLGVSVAASTATAGATIRRGSGAFGANNADVMNGDVLTLRFTAPAGNSVNTPVAITIGGATITLNIATTAASAQPVAYAHGAMLTLDYADAAVRDWGSLSFAAGTAVLAVASATQYPTGVTVGGVAATKRFTQGAAYGSTGFEVWTAPVAAGNHAVVVTYASGYISRHILSYGTITGAAAAPLAIGNMLAPADGDPHVIPATGPLGVPANGLALAFCFLNGGDGTSVVNAGAGHIAQTSVDFQSSRSSLAIAGLTGNQQAGYNFGWSPSPQGWLVWEQN